MKILTLFLLFSSLAFSIEECDVEFENQVKAITIYKDLAKIPWIDHFEGARLARALKFSKQKISYVNKFKEQIRKKKWYYGLVNDEALIEAGIAANLSAKKSLSIYSSIKNFKVKGESRGIPQFGNEKNIATLVQGSILSDNKIKGLNLIEYFEGVGNSVSESYEFIAKVSRAGLALNYSVDDIQEFARLFGLTKDTFVQVGISPLSNKQKYQLLLTRMYAKVGSDKVIERIDKFKAKNLEKGEDPIHLAMLSFIGDKTVKETMRIVKKARQVFPLVGNNEKVNAIEIAMLAKKDVSKVFDFLSEAKQQKGWDGLNYYKELTLAKFVSKKNAVLLLLL